MLYWGFKMLNGWIKVRGKDKQIKVKIPISEEERRKGLNGYRGGDPLVYTYCCPKFFVFVGCEDRPIDIGFAVLDKGLSFRITQVIHGLAPKMEVSGYGILVIETENGGFRYFGLHAGLNLEISIDHLNHKTNLATLLSRKARATLTDLDLDLEMAKEFFMQGFRGEELREALESLGITGERFVRVMEKLKNIIKEWDYKLNMEVLR